MVMPIDAEIVISRKDIATAFPGNPQLQRAFENVVLIAQATPEGVDEAQATAESAQAAANAAQATANGAVSDAADAQTTADGAQAGVLLLNAAPFLTFAASATLSNERVATDTATVTFDLGTAGQVKISVDALAILNALATITFTKPITSTGALTATGAVDIQNTLRCDSLRIDDTPAASVTAASHALPINLNGTTFYLKLSATP